MISNMDNYFSIYINRIKLIYLRFKTRRVASTILDECKPYFFIKSAGLPLSPNLSLTATNSIGAGELLAKTLAIDSPKPPAI